jgi:hypothetical protein
MIPFLNGDNGFCLFTLKSPLEHPFPMGKRCRPELLLSK